VPHHTIPRFWKAYDGLPAHIRDLAEKNFALLKQNPRHPSLQFKKVGRYWSVRVGSYRAFGVECESGIVWFWIGSHAEYNVLTGS
jgi:hypothetical protein